MNNKRKSEEEYVKKQVGNNVSTLISDLRAYLELSRAAFSAPIGLSPTHIARLEKGVTVPSQENINKICEAFEVDKRYFECLIDVKDAVEKKNPEAGVANRLKLARKEKGWSQQELARRSGVDASIINRVEFGAKLTEKQGVKLAEALEVGVEWLLLGKEKKKEYPVDQRMIDWLWEHSDVRKEIWGRMSGNTNPDNIVEFHNIVEFPGNGCGDRSDGSDGCDSGDATRMWRYGLRGQGN